MKRVRDDVVDDLVVYIADGRLAYSARALRKQDDTRLLSLAAHFRSEAPTSESDD